MYSAQGYKGERHHRESACGIVNFLINCFIMTMFWEVRPCLYISYECSMAVVRGGSEGRPPPPSLSFRIEV